jgi:hypothetical protein
VHGREWNWRRQQRALLGLLHSSVDVSSVIVGHKNLPIGVAPEEADGFPSAAKRFRISVGIGPTNTSPPTPRRPGVKVLRFARTAPDRQVTVDVGDGRDMRTLPHHVAGTIPPFTKRRGMAEFSKGLDHAPA